MSKTLFVGGFPYETNERALADFFRSCGTVKSVKILRDKATGRSRGLAIVEMALPAEAEAAARLDGSSLGGRKVFVGPARPPGERRAAAPAPRRPSAPAPRGSSAPALRRAPPPAPRRAASPSEAPGFVERRSGKDRRKAAGAAPSPGAAPPAAAPPRRVRYGKQPWREYNKRKKRWGASDGAAEK